MIRKLTSRQDEEKKARRNRIILSLFLVFIMFFSVIEYSFLSNSGNAEIANNQTNSITYNGFKFTSQNGYWILNKDGTNFIFRYNPNQVSSLNSTLNKLAAYQGKPLYIKTQSLSSEAEIRTNLAPFVNGIIVTNNEKCADNTVIIENKNQSNIYQKENCVYVQGTESELVKLTDEFLFNILEIR